MEKKTHNKTFMYLILSSIIALYISGTTFVSIVLIDVVFQLFGLFVQIFGIFYSSDAYILGVVEQLLWIIYSFGLIVFLFLIILKLYSGFFNTIKDRKQLINDEKISTFNDLMNSENPKIKLIVGILVFLSVSGIFWIFAEIIMDNKFSYSPSVFYYSIILIIPYFLDILRKCYRYVYGNNDEENNKSEELDSYSEKKSETTIQEEDECFPSYQNMNQDTKFIVKNFMDPAGLMDFSDVHGFLDTVKYQAGKSGYKYVIILSIIGAIVCKAILLRLGDFQLTTDFINDKGVVESLFRLIPNLLFVLISPLLIAFNPGHSYDLIFNSEKKKSPLRKFSLLKTVFLGVPVMYFILGIFLMGLSIIWGIFWTSPTKIYRVKELRFINSNVHYNNPPIASQFCSMTSNGLDIVQLSSLPILMNFVNRGRDVKKPLNQIQKNNMKIALQYIFNERAGEVIINESSITQWGLQIIVPTIISNNIKNITIQVYGGYRSPFDWAMFTEIFVQRFFSNIVENIVPFYQIALNLLKSFLMQTRETLNSLSGISSTASEAAISLYQFYHSRPADLIVGQGIGGYFAKYISARSGFKSTTFSFDSVNFFGSLNDSNQKDNSADSIVNVYTEGLYGNIESQLNMNYNRPSPGRFLIAPDAFYAMCNTAAQCSSTKSFHALCMQTTQDYQDILNVYSRE